MPLNLHPKYFPAKEQMAAGLVIAAGMGGGDPLRLAHGIMRAVWANDRNIADSATLKAIAAETGHGKLDLLARAAAADVLKSYAANTGEALERGVFGSPTYIYKDELFWGQDRLDFLDRALAG